jgi:DNA-binding CsgD family transcriptional regulator/N-acetylneuraminic acid mutarotase
MSQFHLPSVIYSNTQIYIIEFALGAFLTEPTLHDKLIFNMHNDPSMTSQIELTEREKEILRLVATGTSNKDIAHQLFISSNTVKVHLRNIFTKIGVVSRTEAAMYAVRMGLVKELGSGSAVLAQAKPSAGEVEQPPALPSQVTEFSTENGPQPAASPTTLIHVSPRSIPVLRMAGMVAVILILLIAVGIGIVVARQPLGSAPNISQMTATPESRWHILAPLPTARAGLAVTVYENQVYAIAGDTDQGVVGVVERYDPLTDSWAEMSQKPTAVMDVNAAVVGGKIYVPGGRTSSGALINTLEIYDPREDTWEKGANLPIKISAYAMTAFEGRIYLFGGWDGNKYLNSVLIYDPTQDKWSLLTPMPEARSFASATVLGDKIYVIGGYNGKQALATNDIYTPSIEGLNSPWEHAAKLPVGCSDVGIASIANNLFVIGKQGTSEVFSIFTPQDNQWQNLDSPLIEIGDGMKLVQVGEYLYLLGGKINNKPIGLALSYQAIYTVQFPVILNK